MTDTPAWGAVAVQMLPAEAVMPVVFAIPVISRVVAHDWAAVEANLAGTVATAVSSEEPDVSVVVAHAERPAGGFWDSPATVSLPVDLPDVSGIERGSRDKRAKLMEIGAWLRRHGPQSGAFVMFLDADDLVSGRLVRFVRENAAGGGVRIDRGWRLDRVARRAVESEKGFARLCGSTFGGFFRPEEFPRDPGDARSPYGQVAATPHARRAERYAAVTGRPVLDVGFPAVAYLVNHAESLHQRVESLAARPIKLERALSVAETGALLARDFAGIVPWAESGVRRPRPA